ncbi:hypothetical protein I79_014293 [Cricetulus griseus]|uniref:Uncharacterized protein n=1 Tax=Cricetulus griseus TaxID=10029 RepID=G3HTR5_CRIGR|nr:hypothetical protein I79_014293 [Cricetulus griseus]
MVTYDCYPSILEAESEASDIQGHPWLHSKLKVSLGYMRPISKGKKRKEKDRVGAISPLTAFISSLALKSASKDRSSTPHHIHTPL